jgi:hypothetical protein
MAKFVSKPVVVEAFQWFKDGDSEFVYPHPLNEKVRCIRTLKGEIMVLPGDWIITGPKGEMYPCKPDIFEATYQKVE